MNLEDLLYLKSNKDWIGSVTVPEFIYLLYSKAATNLINL